MTGDGRGAMPVAGMAPRRFCVDDPSEEKTTMAHCDDKKPNDGETSAALTALEELLRWARRQRFTGVGVVRLSFNQGGVTAARPHTEDVLRMKN